MKHILFLSISLFFIYSCKTEEPQTPPVVITSPATEITLSKAKINGEVTNEGFSAASERGFVMSETNSKPSVSDTKLAIGYGKGPFSKEIDNLKVNTKYYFAAFATNTKGTSYGETLNFTTADYKLASLTLEEPKNITYTTVKLTGTVTDDGGVEVSERGFCLDISPNPTTANIKIINGKGLGIFSTVVTDLKDETSYYVRAYAINGKGISYGTEFNFKTLNYSIPSIETGSAKSIGNTFSTVLGTVKSDGGTELIEKGFVLSTKPNPTLENLKVISSSKEIGKYEITLTELKANTTYYYKAYALNKKGTILGSEETFTTLAATIAKVGTNDFADITESSVRAGLEIDNDGGSPITEYGVCYSSTNSNPSISDKKVVFGYSVKPWFGIMNVITWLTNSTTYYLRGYAINAIGISYGPARMFITNSNMNTLLKNGLVAYFPFNGNANDVGPSKSVSQVYSAELQTDRFNTPNSAYYFSSVGSIPRIEATLNTTSINSALTISIWILKIGEGTNIPRVLEFHPLPIEGPGQLQFSFGYQNSWGVFHRNSSSNPFLPNMPSWFTTFPIGPSKWTHCVYTIDGTTAKFYQDGILLNKFSTTGGNPTLAPNLSIGRVSYPSYDAFNGKLDDFGIWNRALTDTEIQYLYQNNFQP